MLIVRVLAAAAKPALVAAAIGGGATGAYTVAGGDLPGRGHTSAFQQIQDDGQRLIVSEFGPRTDTIVALDPDDPSARTTIARIDHAEGYGVFATLSPDGRAIAYTALPPELGKPSPDDPAQAGIIDIDGGVTLLAGDADLLVAPVWSPDSESVVARRNTPEEDSAGSFELLLLGRDGSRRSITQWASAAVFPIAFAPDGSALYFATLSPSGSDLYRVAPDGSDETLIAHLSDEIARDWKLSPDGATLAYSVAESGATPRIVTKTLDVASGASSEVLTASGPRAEYNPAWSPDNEVTIAAARPGGGADAVLVGDTGATEQIASSRTGIDLPLGWSPDGAKLAVRAIEGASAFEAGESHLELIDGDGTRQRVSRSADVLIVGWLE